MTEDSQIQLRISALIDEEHALREQVQRGELDPAVERARLSQLEEQLDQCWDLLRQRRARREFGEDPDHARPRPVDVVEDYEQ
jgi:chromosome condensin MukBEF complex kleisin-like MukF subunit